jgi:pyruvate,water dikinase
VSGAIWLREATAADEYGGKSVALGAALRAGLPVPDGFALSVAFVEAVVGGDAAARAWLAEVYAALGAGAVAARSSAVGEDGASASFAGQHATKLNVTSAAALEAAVRAVWDSGRTASALAYRAQLGVSGPPRVAVAVQRLVRAEVAGVMFTRDPISGADERVIEAAWGLGEAVVGGLVAPDRYRLDRRGRVVERAAGVKDLMIAPSADGGVEEVEISGARAAAHALADAQLAALHALALRCEQVFGGSGHDIEFAFVGDALHLLQCRPVTKLR